MKKIIKVKNLYVLILSISINCTSLFAQSGWFLQNQFPTSDAVFSMYFNDENTGWAVTNGYTGTGAILKTTNGGLNWAHQNAGIINRWWSVNFTSALTGWVGGGEGILLHTTNGGENWISQFIGTYTALIDVNFASPSTGWIVGNGGILNTTNGGTNWILQTNFSGQLMSSFFISELTGWVVGFAAPNPLYVGKILNTTDGGINWMTQASFPNLDVNSVYFTSSLTGWIAGSSGLVRKTTDGGVTWIPQSVGASTKINSINFTSDSIGWIVGNSGFLRKTTNGGTNWFSQNIVTSKHLYTAFFTSPATGWIGGEDETIYKTVSGGIDPLKLYLTCLIEGFYDDKSGIMVGDTANVYLRNSTPPYLKVDSAKKYLDSNGHSTLGFYNASNATPYFLVFTHRNSIETWSGSAVIFSSDSLNYDFTTDASRAYRNNMILKGSEYCIYNGDVNKDGYVSLSDVTEVYNYGTEYATGYLYTDLNGDNFIDIIDIAIAYNNSTNFVKTISPLNP